MSDEGQKISSPDTWVDEHGDALYRYALLRLRDSTLAQDVVQETFLAALKSKESFSGQSNERTWMVGILKHKIIDHFRKASRETPDPDIESLSEEIDGMFGKGGHWKQPPAHWRHDPDRALDSKELGESISQCLEGLPDKLAQAFTLREMEDLEADEICKILGVSSTNLYVMLHRARLGMRSCIETNWLGTGVRR